MAKHVFTTDLSVKGIKKLISDLEDYKTKTLPARCDEIVSRLLDIGAKTAQAKVSESPLGKYVTITTSVSGNEDCDGILLAKGAVKTQDGYAPFSTLLAIEFGAGIHYNAIANPKADELGYGVGTFPGQIHAFEDMWFYWDEAELQWRPTHGVKATMPMYSAYIEMIQNVVKIVEDVFR